jgi:hypothetical protein
MNANQIAQLNQVRKADRRSQIAVLKTLRTEGVEVLVKLNAATRAIADEVVRLLAVTAKTVKSAFKTVSTQTKAVLAYWENSPVKPLNSRAISGAIALSLKLGF